MAWAWRFAIDQERLELRHTINVGPADLTVAIAHRRRLVGKVYASGLILRVDDYLTWTGRANVFADAPFHSAMGVPLMWQNQVLGVLAITRSKPGQPFTVEDESLAQLLAAQAAAVLRTICVCAPNKPAPWKNSNTLNRRLTGEAWQALDQSLIYEHRQTPTVMPRPGLSLQVPIELRGVPIGTITTLEDAHVRTFTDDEQALINEVTRQLALALENQRLTDIAQSAAQRNRAIAETADNMHELTNLDTILQVAVTELSRITGVSGVGFSWLCARQDQRPPGRSGAGERTMTKPSPAEGGSDYTIWRRHWHRIVTRSCSSSARPGGCARPRIPSCWAIPRAPWKRPNRSARPGLRGWENIHDLSSVRDLAIKLVRQGITYTTASALAQALAGIVTDLTAGDVQHEVTALKLTRHFSAAFLDQIATQHELQTQQEQERLAVQLKASAEVGRAAASILDTH